MGAFDAEVKVFPEGDLDGGGIVRGDHFAEALLDGGAAAEDHGLGLVVEFYFPAGGDEVGVLIFVEVLDGEG